MQRFIKTLAYGLTATALTVFTVNTADAQKGGGGSHNSGGGSFKSGTSSGSKGMPATTLKNNNGGGQFKSQGQAQTMTKQDLIKGGQMNKGFAKGEPNPNTPDGFKVPGNQKMQHNGQSFKDFCGTPYGCKYTPYCNNWKGCYPNWGFNGGWNFGCYSRNYWYSCYYPVNYVLPTSYCFTSYRPVCYADPVCLPTAVQELVQAAPVEPVVTTNTVTKSASQTVTQTAASTAAATDLSFLTMSVFNQ